MILRNEVLVQKHAEDHLQSDNILLGSETNVQYFDQENICSNSIFCKGKGVTNKI